MQTEEMHSSLYQEESHAVSNGQSSSQAMNSSEESSPSSRVRGYLTRQMIGLLENNQSNSSNEIDIQVFESEIRPLRPRVEG